VIHNFGRADHVDRGAGPAGGVDLPVADPEQAAAAGGGGEVEIVASRWLGGAWTLDRLWVGWASARRSGWRRLDGEVAERVVFALVAQRAWNRPASWRRPAGWPSGSPSTRAARRHQNVYLKSHSWDNYAECTSA
jgi:hypothetical protein